MEERRSQRRINVGGKMLYDNKMAQIIDMNLSALKFTCGELLPLGSLLEIAIDMSKPSTKVIGKVIRSRKIGTNDFECVVMLID